MASAEIRIDVECEPEASGSLVPRQLILGTRHIEVSEVVDRWPGKDHEYFKARTGDGTIYIVRHDLLDDRWEIVVHSAPDAERLLQEAAHDGFRRAPFEPEA